MFNSQYLGGLTRSAYGTNGAAALAGVRLDNTPLGDGGIFPFTRAEIDDLIDNQVDNFIPDNSDAIYMVITAPDAVSADAGAGGYNFSTNLVECWISSPTAMPPGSQAFTWNGHCWLARTSSLLIQCAFLNARRR